MKKRNFIICKNIVTFLKSKTKINLKENNLNKQDNNITQKSKTNTQKKITQKSKTNKQQITDKITTTIIKIINFNLNNNNTIKKIIITIYKTKYLIRTQKKEINN